MITQIINMPAALFIFLCICIPLILFMYTTPTAHACSCSSQSLQESFETTDTIFMGRVVGTKKQILYGDITVLFDVSQVWKGSVKNQLTVETPSEGTACGAHFEENQEYVVFAREDNGTLRTGICMHPSTGWEGDIAAHLNNYATPTLPTTTPTATEQPLYRYSVVKLMTLILVCCGVVILWRRRTKRA